MLRRDRSLWSGLHSEAGLSWLGASCSGGLDAALLLPWRQNLKQGVYLKTSPMDPAVCLCGKDAPGSSNSQASTLSSCCCFRCLEFSDSLPLRARLMLNESGV